MSVAKSCLVSACVLTATLSAQGRVWTVDVQNRPGTDFIDLPPAVAAASDGDMIRVRAGSYQGATISRALTILADTGTSINPFSTPLTVQGLPAGRQVVLKGFALTQSLFSGGALVLTANQGCVLLDRLTVSAGGTAPALAITDCRQVQINSSSFTGGGGFVLGGPALNATRSMVTISDSQARGGASFAGHGFWVGSAALVAQDADVTISRGTTDGGAGTSFGSLPDKPAIESTNSRISLRGDAGTWVRAGQSHNGSVSAIVANGGSVTLDPAVNLLSNNPGVPAISGTAAVVSTWLPSLSARGVGPGGTVNADLFSPAGDVALFLTSLPGEPLDLSPAGWFWLEPNVFFVTGVGVVGATGHLAHPLPLPVDPNLSFGAWALQSLSGTFPGGFRLSNGVGYVLAN